MKENEKDLYRTLGISRNADEKTIKSAYRKLAKKYHPDTNQGNKTAEQKFQEISEAYDILGDEKKKKLYDKYGMAAFDGRMGPDPEAYAKEMEKMRAAGGFGGFANGSFNRDGGGHSWSDGNGNYHYSYSTGDGSSGGPDNDEWINEFVKNMFHGNKTGFNGSGFNGSGFNGSGFNGSGFNGSGFNGSGFNGSGFNGSGFNGSGFGDSGFGSFGFGGSGQDFVYEEQAGSNIHSELTITFEEAALGCDKRIRFEDAPGKMMDVHIPAGIDEGQSIRLKGKGAAGRNGHAGDLLLRVHILDKPGYSRKGKDVYVTENIPFTTAVLGGTAYFRTLSGLVECKVPAGTQSGSRIRLKGRGIVSMKDPASFGDEYVTIQIIVPKDLSQEERQAVESLKRAQEHKYSRGGAA